MSGPYKVAKRRADQWHIRFWVVGPDGDIQGFHRDDEQRAVYFCRALNTAYAAGRAGGDALDMNHPALLEGARSLKATMMQPNFLQRALDCYKAINRSLLAPQADKDQT